MAHRFYGKYRGTVVNNIDPMFLGRILAEVPAVPGVTTSFAMPCVPYAGPNVGFYAIPAIGSNVWIEFEEGDPDHPIWSGCFWGTGEIPMPAGAPLSDTQIFQTGSVSIVFNSLPNGGGFSLTCNPAGAAGPLTLQFTAAGAAIGTGDASISISPDGIGLAIGATKISLDGVVLNAATTELQVAASMATVESAVVQVQGTVSVQGALSVEGPTLMDGGLNLTGGGTVDGKPLA